MTAVKKRADTEDKDSEVAEAKKAQSIAGRELTQTEKLILSHENSIQQKRHDRHSLLQACKVSVSYILAQMFVRFLVEQHHSSTNKGITG